MFPRGSHPARRALAPRSKRVGIPAACAAVAIGLLGLVWIEGTPAEVAAQERGEPREGQEQSSIAVDMQAVEPISSPSAARERRPLEDRAPLPPQNRLAVRERRALEVRAPLPSQNPLAAIEPRAPDRADDRYPGFWSRERRGNWDRLRAAIVGDSSEDLIASLEHDRVWWNACVAAAELGDRILYESDRTHTRALLEKALDSKDEQQRFLALGLLQAFALVPTPGGHPYYPTERMLEVFFESITPKGYSRYSWRPGYRYSMEFIPYEPSSEKTVAFALQFIDRIELRLVDLLEKTRHEELRIFCAYVLARTQNGQPPSIIAPVLVEHLRDNSISNDALMAMEGLYALGPGSIAWLEAAQLDDDPQAKACAELLTLELYGPARNSAERERRDQLTDLTSKCYNPVLDWSYLTRDDFLLGYTSGL